MRWQPITERGIRLDYRTYNHEVLDPHRGQRSGVASKDGKWEVHHNPHDARQIWVRLTDGKLHEIGWIHRDHVHQPFNDALWRHIQTEVEQRGDRETHEADLADALDQLLRRTRHPAGTEHNTRRRRTPRSASTAAQLPDLPGQRRSSTRRPHRPRPRSGARALTTSSPLMRRPRRTRAIRKARACWRPRQADTGCGTPKRRPSNGEHLTGHGQGAGGQVPVGSGPASRCRGKHRRRRR
nr:Mu transposase C-terminal domain-containing protein [Streptomyces sp. FXJ1.172]WEP00963.1 Mu transposase C-terminal domain-containing protein [Streptomyces sp. FXJ1.172]